MGFFRLQPKIIFLMVITILLAAACTRSNKLNPTETPEKGVVITVDADVKEIQIHATDTYPVQASVTVSGVLPDSCTQIGDAEQDVSGKTIHLTVHMDRPITAVCGEGEVPFEKTYPLDVKGLSAGKYTVDVNEVTASLEIPEAPLISSNSSQACPKAAEGTVSYVNEADGYCLLHPTGFSVQSAISNTVVLASPPLGNGDEKARASLTIETITDATGRSAEDIAAEHLSSVGSDAAGISGETINLGGEQAISADGVPGELITRQVFVVHDGAGYVLTFSPVDSATPLATQAADQLWKAVSASFTFIERQGTTAIKTCTPNSLFLEDVTIPDGTQVPVGKPFIKTWSLRNTGTCTWDSSYQLVQIDAEGNLLTANPMAINLPKTDPGKKAELSVSLSLSADTPVGSQQRAEFQMHAPNGEMFGTTVFALVTAASPGAPDN